VAKEVVAREVVAREVAAREVAAPTGVLLPSASKVDLPESNFGISDFKFQISDSLADRRMKLL